MSRIVFTGGPGAGKTSVIEELAKRGHNIVPEPARTLIDKYKIDSPELLPSISKENRNLFQTAIEKETIKNYHDNQTGFFDRSILDEIGYRNRYNIDINIELDYAAKNYRYNTVFIFPFWKEIYKNDDVRHETPEEAEIIYNYLHGAYTKYGYNPIIVPKIETIKRVEFILENI